MMFLRLFALTLGLSFAPFVALAQSFPDVPASHPDAAAVEYVKQKGIFQGYADGTFKPKKSVTRAEAVKILVASKLTPDVIATFSQRSYTDVPEGAWYRAFVEAAFHRLSLIDGPPKTSTFNGDKSVTRAQFLKMLLKANDIDVASAFGEIKLPVSTDVTDSAAWYYPPMRYAISASLIQVNPDGTLKPEAVLTRGDVATLIYRLAMYQSGKRTQALLSEEEAELVNTLTLLEGKEWELANMASARALIAARGAHQSKPDVAIVQAAVKIAEAFRSLVRGYKAGTDGNLSETIRLMKEAWGLAEKARQISPTLTELSGRVQTIASGMADQAREMLKSEAAPSSK